MKQTPEDAVLQEPSLTFIPPDGAITGWPDDGVIRATGIAYATAARFGKPVAVPARNDPFHATGWSPACPQSSVTTLEKLLGTSPLEHLAMDENCQHLSLTLPGHFTPGNRLPVMVWIHGGSYTSGAGDATVFDPKPLVKEQQVIVVNVTYRLGLFGFLGGWAGRPANLGLFDMIEALRWVNRNIAAFGGDPGNVTLFGQSAGGDAIAHLMIAEGVAGLFQKVIIQSAPLGLSLGRKAMTGAMGTVAAGIPAGATSDEVVALQEPVAAIAKKFGLRSGMPFGTQYGHAPLPDETGLEVAWSRSAPHYKVLIGCTEEETSLFLPLVKSAERMSRWPLVGDLIKQVLVRITTRKVYGKAAASFARRHAKAGGDATLYRIRWGSATNGLGATHMIDLPLLFGDEATWKRAELIRGIPWPVVEDRGNMLRSLWARFARTGELGEGSKADRAVITWKRVGGQ